MTGSLAVAAAALVFNYLTVTGLIFVNKALFSFAKFPPTVLTSMHLAFTGGAIYLLQRAGFVAKPATPLSWRYTALLAGLQGCAIVAGNASLTFNSMSFYQLAKQLQLPVVLSLEFALFDKRLSAWKLGWLACAVVGVVTATTQDVHFNALGALCAVAGVVCTAAEVVIWSRLQQHHGWGSLQLLGSVSPYGAALTGVGAVVGGDVAALAGGSQIQGPAFVLMCVSCAAALLVNWSTVMVSGKASAITYALLGLFKTSSVLVGGALFFDGVPSSTVLAGACFALVSILGYSHCNIKEQRAKQQQQQQAEKEKEKDAESAGGSAQLVPAIHHVRSASQESSPGASDEDVSPSRSLDGSDAVEEAHC